MTLQRWPVALISRASRWLASPRRRGVGCVGFLSQAAREAALLLG